MATNRSKKVTTRNRLDDMNNVRVITSNFEFLLAEDAFGKLPVHTFTYKDYEDLEDEGSFMRMLIKLDDDIAEKLVPMILTIPGIRQVSISPFEIHILKFEPEDWYQDLLPHIYKAIEEAYPGIKIIV